MVGFSITPAAGEVILKHPLCVSLVSLLKETVSKICLFKIGQWIAPRIMHYSYISFALHFICITFKKTAMSS